MEILTHRALRGPNFYSRFPVTFMTLDIGGLEETPSDMIPGLADRIKATMPTLVEHRCSPGRVGGFFERLDRGTWAGHIVEHLSLELQCLAGMHVGFGKTRETTRRGIYSVVYRHLDEECGLLAGRHAVDLLGRLILGETVDVAPMVQELRETREKNLLGPSTRSIVEAAEKRGVPIMRLNKASHVMLGHGIKQQHIQASMTGKTTALSVAIAADKEWTKKLLHEAGISVPWGASAATLDEALTIATDVGYPVVTKPLDGNHGRGITTDVKDAAELAISYEAARAHHERVVVERFLVGRDHRLLVIGGKLQAAAQRDPAAVVGDGVHTIAQLIDLVNADPRRGFGHEKSLTRIEIDPDSERMLAIAGLTLESIPDAGRNVDLKSTANLSTGGTATDVTDELHPHVKLMAERVASIVGLDVMGIDIVAPHLRAPLEETGGGIVEVNAGPGLRMHLDPTGGTPRDVAAPIIDALFDDGGRIPIIAVTGTNGKTTTVRLIAHILKLHGAHVGIASTSSVEVDNQIILRGDYSGPDGAKAVLREPTVSHAVIEVARGGILRRGLAFDRCDVGILLNIGRDHIGEGDIHDLDDLLRLKSTVPDVAQTAVLNADDERVLSLQPQMDGKVILFSMDPRHPALLAHIAADPENVVVTCVKDAIVVRRDRAEFRIAAFRDIPLTLDGKAKFNVQNAMAAVAGGYALGLTEETVRAALMTFHPNVGQNRGRLNVFDVGDFRVVLDFGHNVPALAAFDEVIPHLRPRAVGRVLRVAYLAGNRLDEDLRQVGAAMGRKADRLWLSDPDPRSRAEGETPALLAEGAIAAGLDASNVTIAVDEWANIRAAFDAARAGDLLIILCEDLAGVVSHVRRLQVEVADARARGVVA